MNDDHDNAQTDKAILEKLIRKPNRARKRRAPDHGAMLVQCCHCHRVHRYRERVMVPISETGTSIVLESRCPKCNRAPYTIIEKE